MAFFDRNKVKIDLHLNRDFFIPGQTLRGRLHLTVTKSVSLTAVRLRIMGKEKAIRRANSRTTLLEEFTHLECVMTFLGKPQDSSRKGTCRLAAGDYDYPFQLELPATLPPSLYCPVRRMKTKVYYFVEANILVPNGFDGRKRQYITVFPAAPRAQWDVAHAVPYGLTDYAPEQLAGANMVKALSQQQLLRQQQHRDAAASAAAGGGNGSGGGSYQTNVDEIAEEKARASREAELPRKCPARGRAAPSAGDVAADGVNGEHLVVDDAVRLPVRKRRFGRKNPGWLELSVKVLPCVMALSTHSMFPIVSALNEASNTRVNREDHNSCRSDDDDIDDDTDGEEENGDTMEDGARRNAGYDSSPSSSSSSRRCGGDGGGKGASNTLNRSVEWTDPAISAMADSRHAARPRPSAPAASDDSGSESLNDKAEKPVGNQNANDDNNVHGRHESGHAEGDGVGDDASSSTATSQPETVCAPTVRVGSPAHPAITASLPAPPRTAASTANAVSGPSGNAGVLRSTSTTGASRVPSVVRPVVQGTNDARGQQQRQQQVGSPDSPSGANGQGSNASFSRALTTYDDCRCLVRITLHNGTESRKIKAVAVSLMQFLRLDSAGRHATQSVKMAEARYVPPQGPLRPGQTVTFDVQLQLPDMLRMKGEMDRRLPAPTLRTRTLDVTSVLMVSFKGGVKLEHQFSRSDCIALVSAVDETNTVPDAPYAYTSPHVFPEEVVSDHVY